MFRRQLSVLPVTTELHDALLKQEIFVSRQADKSRVPPAKVARCFFHSVVFGRLKPSIQSTNSTVAKTALPPSR